MILDSPVADLARAVYRGDFDAARRVLLENRHTVSTFNVGIRAAERDMGRDEPIPQLERDWLTMPPAERSAYLDGTSPKPQRRKKAA